MSATQMLLSHPIQTQNKPHHFLEPISHYFEGINKVRQNYSSFELAEKAIKELVVELAYFRNNLQFASLYIHHLNKPHLLHRFYWSFERRSFSMI